jgi:hypothetical protein
MAKEEIAALEADTLARRIAAQAIRDEANLIAPWSGSLPRRWLWQDGIMGQLQSVALGPRYRSTEFGEAVKAEILAIADRLDADQPFGEREACAMVAEDCVADIPHCQPAAALIAAAIRARGDR